MVTPIEAARDPWTEGIERWGGPDVPPLSPDSAQGQGPGADRFDEWLQRLGYEDGTGRWCCPVADAFGAGWRAGYADGVHAAVRLLRAAYAPEETLGRGLAYGPELWSEPAHRGWSNISDSSVSDGPPPPLPLTRGRRR